VISKYRSPDMALELEELDDPARHDLIVCDFLTPSINLFPQTPNARPPRCKTLLFQHNVEAQIWERLYQQQTNPVKRWYFKLQWQRLKEYERRISAKFDGVVAVSEEDGRIFRQQYGLTNVLGSVPTGVDVDFFAKMHGHPEPGNVAFLGSMDWMPNIDAVNWFVAEIFPLLKQRVPSATFTIIGRNPPEAIQALAKRDSAIRVTGTVPDIRPHLAKAEAMIVPLRVGGGTRIKIYEAMAAGLPVVSTRIGAEGLQVAHGENILLADTPADFAEQTASLLQTPELRQKIGHDARELVRKQFGWPTVTKVFAEYCRAVTRTSPK
jgi:glycosyltransferase involved in cell wall biosynthesis